jgi:putative transposase
MGQHLVWAARENGLRCCLSSRQPPLSRPGDRRPGERQRHAEAQRVNCVRIVHWMRNALAHVPKGQQTMVAAALRQAFLQADQANARQVWRQVADQLRPRWPKLAALMDESEHDVLAYMGFPAQHRAKLHSTNPLERLNKEVKRRADVVGIFPSEPSIVRLIGAVLLEQNDEWQLRHRYMQVEAMAELASPAAEAEPALIPPEAA